MAGPTRLELATSGVTGQRSNQLNYDPAEQTLNFDVRTSKVVRAIWLACHGSLGERPSLPAVARGASEGWWAVQGSNL
jgi:hypothetical protein